MRTAATVFVALLGLLIGPRALWAGRASSEVTICVHVEPQAEWALPAPSQATSRLQVHLCGEIELQQLLRPCTNARATLTWTVVRWSALATHPAADTGQMIIDNSDTRVVGSWGGSPRTQIDPAQTPSGGDAGQRRAFVGAIIAIVLTLSWP